MIKNSLLICVTLLSTIHNSYCANQLAKVTATSIVNTATAIASYQVLRAIGAKPSIQATPYGMTTTTQDTADYAQNSSQSSYANQNEQNQKEQFMQD